MATSYSKLDRETLRQLNLYEVLQVSAKASPEVIQAAYRVLARSYHPDVNASPNAARMMRQLNAAYKVLSDPERRARYDAQRAHSWRARSAANVHVGRTNESAAVRTVRPAMRSSVPRPSVQLRSSWPVGRLIGLLLLLLMMLG